MRDARRMGLPEAAIAAIRARLAGASEEDGGGLWPEHGPIVAAFLAVQTQWRTAALAGGLAPGRLIYVGLDYESVRAGLDAAGIAVSPRLWGGLRTIEAEARAILNGLEA